NSNDSGPGSLREAIGKASAAPTADIVTFLPAFFSSPRIISLSSALPEITGQLTINGPGASLLTVERDSAASSLFGLLASSATALNINGITFSGGHASFEAGGLNITGINPIISLDGVIFSENISEEGGGGAIALDDFALLSIRNSTISGNTSGGSGGGIYFYGGGSLVLENSTVSGNSVNTQHNGYGGGGIYFTGDVSTQNVTGFVPGTLVIRNSTISNNSTPFDGGAIYLQSFDGTLLVQNSTISGNSATSYGGAVALIDGIGSLVFQNSTISANSVTGTGGGIARVSGGAGNITITNSIVSGNSSFIAPDIFASQTTTTLANFSAIGSSDGFTMDAASANNLPFGANLLLGSLANNGGASPTLLPQTGSPLIGAGSNASTPAALTTDQRGAGFARIFGPIIDIGAIEVQPIPYPLASAGTSNITTAG